MNRLSDQGSGILNLRFFEGKTKWRSPPRWASLRPRSPRLEKSAINQIKKNL